MLVKDITNPYLKNEVRCIGPEYVESLIVNVRLMGQKNPVVVNANMEVVEGRYLFEAVKSLGDTVHAIFEDQRKARFGPSLIAAVEKHVKTDEELKNQVLRTWEWLKKELTLIGAKHQLGLVVGETYISLGTFPQAMFHLYPNCIKLGDRSFDNEQALVEPVSALIVRSLKDN